MGSCELQREMRLADGCVRLNIYREVIAAQARELIPESGRKRFGYDTSRELALLSRDPICREGRSSRA